MAPKRSSTTVSGYRQLSPNLLHRLATVLGYLLESGEACETPYIRYILGQWPGEGTLDEYVRLVVNIIEYFIHGEDSQSTKGLNLRRKTSTIKQCIDGLVDDLTQPYFRHLLPDDGTRRRVVVDTVLLILGSWTLMQSYFIPQRGEPRRILLAYCWNNDKEYLETSGLEETLTGLLTKSGLLPNPSENVNPEHISKGSLIMKVTGDESALSSSRSALHPSLGSVESLEIAATTLNAFKLGNLGAVRILWTNNLSRHMLLSNHAKKFYLELFAIPSALQDGPDSALKYTGISSDLMDEICQSYANLFNPKVSRRSHTYLGRLFGAKFWCWCLPCSSRRLMNNQLRKLKSNSPVPGDIKLTDSTRPKFDPALKDLMSKNARGWDQTEFEYLWPRIVILDAHLSGSKPWSFWVIFRDRRDSVQFWTFLFGTIILFLTFVQVFLGIAQVASGFL
ncbi:hypothetical protein BKA56DRAFT_598114 [Ilyonectria sp. MPI-CAGE-AT-0026]|nr:hypothetical protein BKA56DRAFT_598114 [Ilyonectria sp. MPI-CAGE-AT-0026]